MGLCCCKSSEPKEEGFEDICDSEKSSFRRPRFSLKLKKSVRGKLRPSVFQASSDCADCMLVEIGEKAAYFPGEPCDRCGRVPRAPYINY